jgi:hypothetical protein
MPQKSFTTTVQPVIITRLQYQGEYGSYRKKMSGLGELLKEKVYELYIQGLGMY